MGSENSVDSVGGVDSAGGIDGLSSVGCGTCIDNFNENAKLNKQQK